MKKLVKTLGASLLALSAVAFFSCGSDGDEYNYNSDTVLSLDSPSVSGTAYYGVNYITWKPIAGAKSFSLVRYEDGSSSGKVLVSSDDWTANSVYAYEDIATSSNLVDGKTYKYVLQAISKSDPSRAIAVKSSQSETSVKANVPSKNFPDFDTDYANKFSSSSVKSNVTVSLDDKGIRVSFPAKAYLNYTLDATSLSDSSTASASVNGAYGSDYTETVVLSPDSGSFSAGAYKISFTVAPKASTLYSSVSESFVANLTADETASSATLSVAAANLDSDGVTNDVYVKVTKSSSDTTVAVAYTADTDVAISDSASWKTVALTSSVDNSNYLYGNVKDLAEGTYVFRLVSSETDKEDSTSYEVVTIEKATVASSDLKLSSNGSVYVSSSSTSATNVYLTISDSASKTEETFSNYTYKVYRAVYGYLDSNENYATLGDYAQVAEVTSSMFDYAYDETDEDKVNYVAELTDTISEAGIYVYYVEKTDSVTNTSAKAYTQVTASESSSNYAYTPVIYDDSESVTLSDVSVWNSTTSSSVTYTTTWKIGSNEITSPYTIPDSGRTADYAKTVNINFGYKYPNSNNYYDPSTAFESIALYRAQLYPYSSESLLESNFEKLSATASSVIATGTYTVDSEEKTTTQTLYFQFADTVDSGYDDYVYVIVGTDSEGNKYYSNLLTID